MKYMKQNLLILGAGQYGLLAKEIAQTMGCFEKIDFLDDHSAAAVGKLRDHPAFADRYGCAFVAIGNSGLRMELIRSLEERGYALPVLRHPSAVVMPSAVIGQGSIIEACAVINANTEVAAGCIVSAGAVINHNSAVGPGCHIDCNAVVPSNCTVPSGTKVCCGQVFGGNNL